MPLILAPSMTERMERGGYLDNWKIKLPTSKRISKILKTKIQTNKL